jgi:hypothetical protein
LIAEEATFAVQPVCSQPAICGGDVLGDQNPRPVQVVTISASFGAGGSIVGPAVAERLGVPFLDRAIPLAVARLLAVPVEKALEQDERSPSIMERVMANMAAAGAPLGMSPTPDPAATPSRDAFCAATERVLLDLADDGGGVVLGRGAAVVLAGRPSALHVRLDGPRSARVARVMALEEVGADAAAKLVDHTDRAWEAYVRYFYKTDPRESRLYHLVIDSTVVPLTACVELVIAAASARRLPDDGVPA